MRERQLLDALAAGHANKIIAYDLGISVRTVEVRRARMLELERLGRGDSPKQFVGRSWRRILASRKLTTIMATARQRR